MTRIVYSIQLSDLFINDLYISYGQKLTLISWKVPVVANLIEIFVENMVLKL